VQGSEALVLAGWPAVTANRVPLVIEVAPWLLRQSGTLDVLVGQLGAYDSFVDLRFSDRPVPVDQLDGWVQSIPDGHHRDLLMR
jgi:hypothetical protein